MKARKCVVYLNYLATNVCFDNKNIMKIYIKIFDHAMAIKFNKIYITFTKIRGFVI